MNLKDLAEFCREKIKEYPYLELFIVEAYDLAQSESESNESEIHECELAVGDINDKIEELNESKPNT